MAFHPQLKLRHWISQRQGARGAPMNSALCAGCRARSCACRQPVFQTRSGLVPLRLLRAFCTQRLWRHSLDEFTEWTIKAFTMCFKGRISFSRLSHVSIHFLLLLIFGLFFPPLVQLYSVCSAFSCLDFVPYTLHCAFLLLSVIRVSCSHQIVFFQLLFFAFLILCLLFPLHSYNKFLIFLSRSVEQNILFVHCVFEKSANNYLPRIKW